jgi:GNAT superfamily N-acetyltransferase
MVEVRPVPAEATRPLRQQVLRPHQTLDALAAEDARDPGGSWFAAFGADGEVVATGILSRREEGWQVRGMAVAPGHRGRGLGSAVLATLLDVAASRGGGLVWCNARVPARRLYERAGFEAVGDVFEVARIGPHVTMELRLGECDRDPHDQHEDRQDTEDAEEGNHAPTVRPPQVP